MIRNLMILSAAALVVALPFALRPRSESGDWRPGDPVLVVITPHNEAIRYEFGRAFSAWHQQRYGRPVQVDWRMVGGTTEISRYLASQFVAAFRAWWKDQGQPWPRGAADAMLGRKPPVDRSFAALWHAFREIDDPRKYNAGIDLFFGGGSYDHEMARAQGLTVRPWPAGGEPPGLFVSGNGEVLIPESVSGETWRTPYLFGTCLSTFGICYNRDRLRDLGVAVPPSQWVDLTDPVYIGQIGVADPTKSGSIAKSFEMIIQQQCRETVIRAGYTDADIDRWEREPSAAPAGYASALADGWVGGVNLIRLIGANARYFTDGASKVPVDVSMGDVAAGLAIDFYARYQAQAGAADRMVYCTPVGGSSVSADPISLLRGAPDRAVAVRFLEFVLGESGQRLWNDAPGRPCSRVQKYALRRLPIRRDFYPPRAYPQGCATDDLADPDIDPYVLAKAFTYRPRWTAAHFNVHRDLVKAMCLDSGEELRAAWRAIIRHGGPSRQAQAMTLLMQLPDRPEPLTWQSAPSIVRKYDRLDYLREWTAFFREKYRQAKDMAEAKPSAVGRGSPDPALTDDRKSPGDEGETWRLAGAARSGDQRRTRKADREATP